MTAITLTVATEMFDKYLDAEKCILTGAQSYSIGDRSLTRADLKFITSERRKWQLVCERLEKGSRGIPVMRGLPRDL